MCFSKRQFQGMWATLTQHTQTLWASSRLKACITSIKRSNLFFLQLHSDCLLSIPTTCGDKSFQNLIHDGLSSVWRGGPLWTNLSTSLPSSLFHSLLSALLHTPQHPHSPLPSHSTISFSCREPYPPALLQPCPPLQRRLITCSFLPPHQRHRTKLARRKSCVESVGRGAIRSPTATQATQFSTLSSSESWKSGEKDEIGRTKKSSRLNK